MIIEGNRLADTDPRPERENRTRQARVTRLPRGDDFDRESGTVWMAEAAQESSHDWHANCHVSEAHDDERGCAAGTSERWLAEDGTLERWSFASAWSASVRGDLVPFMV